MANPGVHLMVTGGQAILAACGAMVVYGFIKVRSALETLSSCDMDGCEMRRLYSEFRNDMEALRQARTQAEKPCGDIAKDVLDSFLNLSPPSDKRLLH